MCNRKLLCFSSKMQICHLWLYLLMISFESYEELQKGETYGQTEVGRHSCQQGPETSEWGQFACPVNGMRLQLSDLTFAKRCNFSSFIPQRCNNRREQQSRNRAKDQITFPHHPQLAFSPIGMFGFF